MLHPVKHTGNIKPALVQFVGKILHPYLHHFGSGLCKTAEAEKVYELLPDTVRLPPPWNTSHSLCQHRYTVEKIQTENEMVVKEAQYFLLVQGEQTAIGLCNEVLGVMLHKSEQKFRLNHRWRLHLLFYTVPVAVGVADDTENPVDYDLLTGSTWSLGVKTDEPDGLSVQNSICISMPIHYSTTFPFIEGLYQTLSFPLASE